jgi:hypothetical protein
MLSIRNNRKNGTKIQLNRMSRLKEKNPSSLKKILKIIQIRSLTTTCKLKKLNQLSWCNVLRVVEENSILKL